MRIELLKPHTHVGKSLQPGDVLDLDADLADWLIREGVAKAVSNEPEHPFPAKPHKEEKSK